MKRLLVLISGILLIAVGIFLIIHGNGMKKRCTEPATAVVVQNVEETEFDDDNNLRYLYYPMFEFRAGDETVTVKGKNGQNPAEYQLQDKVELLYNPADPQEFLVKGEAGSALFGIIFIVVGVVVSAVGVKVFLTGR